MPKKRHTNLYSKPPSTAHRSLNSTAASSSSNHQDGPPTVNELITNLRRSHVSPKDATATSPIVTRTLPPQIRQLLSQPETPIPRDRRQRVDATGRRLPPGPAPPRSWLEGSRHGNKRATNAERLYPQDINTLPGVVGGGTRKLQEMCLRTMAREWEFIRVYESNNLAGLPVGVRMLLMSYIAVYGPEEGIGSEGLNALLKPTDEEYYKAENNDGFFRIDLSGSLGRSVSFKQLIDLVQAPNSLPVIPNLELSWEDSISPSIGITIPHLTYLSISHPPSTISWPRLLTFAKHVPTLTHLSLAHWPVPSLTPNATTAFMSSPYGKDVQYGGTNYYSHSVDDDFQEAAGILKRLASYVYNLEYLDIEGCTDWLHALRWVGSDPVTSEGIDWHTQWVKMKTLVIRCGFVLHEDSKYWEVQRFTHDFRRMFMLQKYLTRIRRGRWIEVVRDDWETYEGFWKDGTDESNMKHNQIDAFKVNWWTDEFERILAEAPVMVQDVERRSVWEQ